MQGLLLQFVGSLAAIIAVVLLAHKLGFSRRAKLTSEDEALALFRLAPGGFEPIAIALDEDGRAAIARDARNRLAVLLPHGSHFVAMRVEQDVDLVADGDILHVQAEHIPAQALKLGPIAQDWAAKAPAAN